MASHDRPQPPSAAARAFRTDITAEDKLRIGVCVTVPGDTKPEGEAGAMRVEGGRYAVATYLLDPSEYGAAWNWLMGRSDHAIVRPG